MKFPACSLKRYPQVCCLIYFLCQEAGQWGLVLPYSTCKNTPSLFEILITSGSAGLVTLFSILSFSKVTSTSFFSFFAIVLKQLSLTWFQESWARKQGSVLLNKNLSRLPFLHFHFCNGSQSQHRIPKWPTKQYRWVYSICKWVQSLFSFHVQIQEQNQYECVFLSFWYQLRIIM